MSGQVADVRDCVSLWSTHRKDSRDDRSLPGGWRGDDDPRPNRLRPPAPRQCDGGPSGQEQCPRYSWSTPVRARRRRRRSRPRMLVCWCRRMVLSTNAPALRAAIDMLGPGGEIVLVTIAPSPEHVRYGMIVAVTCWPILTSKKRRLRGRLATTWLAWPTAPHRSVADQREDRRAGRRPCQWYRHGRARQAGGPHRDGDPWSHRHQRAGAGQRGWHHVAFMANFRRAGASQPADPTRKWASSAGVRGTGYASNVLSVPATRG